MLFNYVLGIYCFHCKKYCNPHTEVFINVLGDETLSCNQGHLLGFTWDKEWQDFWRQDE